mgnify:FL=1
MAGKRKYDRGKIAELLERGVEIESIAKIMGCNRSVVCATNKGLKVRRRDKVVLDYLAGHRVEDIKEKYGYKSNIAIYGIVDRAGVAKRRRLGRRCVFDRKTIDFYLKEGRKSVREIAGLMGCSSTLVYYRKTALGMKRYGWKKKSILMLIDKGLSNKEIVNQIGVSMHYCQSVRRSLLVG